MGQAGTAAREQGHLAELCWGQRAQGWPHASQAPHLLQALVGFSPSGVLYRPWSWGCLPSQFSSSKPMRWQQQERGQSTECPALQHQNAMHASASQGRVVPAASSPQPWAPPSGSSHQPPTGGWGGSRHAAHPSEGLPGPCSHPVPLLPQAPWAPQKDEPSMLLSAQDQTPGLPAHPTRGQVQAARGAMPHPYAGLKCSTPYPRTTTSQLHLQSLCSK